MSHTSDQVGGLKNIEKCDPLRKLTACAMSASNTTRWSKIKALDSDVCQITQETESFTAITHNSIHCFNSMTRKFGKSIDISKIVGGSLGDYENHCMVFDDAQHILYHNKPSVPGSWSANKLKTNESTKICTSDVKNDGAKGLIINHEFHLIGGDFNIHHKYNPNTKQYKNVSDMSALLTGYTMGSSQFAVKSQNGKAIYLLHINHTIGDEKRLILRYSISENKWENISFSLPPRVSEFVAAPVKNDKFIILFAGNQHGSVATPAQGINDIWVINMASFRLNKCKIKCPVTGKVSVGVDTGKHRNKMTTFGFVNDLWKNPEFNGMVKPPLYLINYIVAYGQQEDLYLFWRNLGWRISVNDLLDNTDS